jgi:hypothetical protein
MKSVMIKDTYLLGQHEHKLQFDDGSPVVVGYCRASGAANINDPALMQMASITEACEQKLGRYGYNMIWVIEYDKRKLGVALALELIKRGSAQFLAVHSAARLTRNCRDAQETAELLASTGGEVILAEAVLAQIKRKPSPKDSGLEILNYLHRQSFDALTSHLPPQTWVPPFCRWNRAYSKAHRTRRRRRKPKPDAPSSV